VLSTGPKIISEYGIPPKVIATIFMSCDKPLEGAKLLLDFVESVCGKKGEEEDPRIPSAYSHTVLLQSSGGKRDSASETLEKFEKVCGPIPAAMLLGAFVANDGDITGIIGSINRCLRADSFSRESVTSCITVCLYFLVTGSYGLRTRDGLIQYINILCTMMPPEDICIPLDADMSVLVILLNILRLSTVSPRQRGNIQALLRLTVQKSLHNHPDDPRLWLLWGTVRSGMNLTTFESFRNTINMLASICPDCPACIEAATAYGSASKIAKNAPFCCAEHLKDSSSNKKRTLIGTVFPALYIL